MAQGVHPPPGDFPFFLAHDINRGMLNAVWQVNLVTLPLQPGDGMWLVGMNSAVKHDDGWRLTR